LYFEPAESKIVIEQDNHYYEEKDRRITYDPWEWILKKGTKKGSGFTNDREGQPSRDEAWYKLKTVDARPPVVGLAHELQHALDEINGLFLEGNVERNAIKTENIIRINYMKKFNMNLNIRVDNESFIHPIP